jgi:uncharacterized protein (TIGR00251 family)
MLKEFVQKHNPQYLRIKVIPKSARNEVIEIMDDDTIKIRIKAVPEKGKANKELVSFLAQELKMPKDSFEIISGKHDPLKLVKISS